MRDNQGSVCFIPTREGVTQGDPLFMVTYRLGILPLICYIKLLVLALHQPWYTNDASIVETWALIVEYFNVITIHGPLYGFFPEP